MTGVNLLPAPVLAARRRLHKKRLWFRSMLAYSSMLLAGGLAVDGVLIEPVGALEAESVSLDADLAAAEAQLGLLEQNRERLTAEVQVLREIHGQPDWSVLLTHLSEHLGSDVTIQSVRVAIAGEARSRITPGQLARGPYRVELSGIARAQSHVTEYVIRLEQAGLLDQITLRGTSPTRSGDEVAVLFSLDATIGVGGGG